MAQLSYVIDSQTELLNILVKFVKNSTNEQICDNCINAIDMLLRCIFKQSENISYVCDSYVGFK